MNTATSIVAAAATNNNANAATQPTENAKQPQQNQTAQQLVRENVQYLIEQLEAGHSEALTGFLRAMAVFRNYSLPNQMAIARQRPTGYACCRDVRMESAWPVCQQGRERHRDPCAGRWQTQQAREETEPQESDKPLLLGFRRVYVWDKEQTHGLPLA